MNCEKGKGCEYFSEDDGWKRDCCFLCKSQTECLKNSKVEFLLDDIAPCFNHKQFRKCRGCK